MNLLAIDSAASILSIAVSRGEEIFCEDTEAGMKHSELVLDCIEKQMKRAALSPTDLNGVLCMGGPGSFTGLRIGYSIAKGLALSLSIPFAAIPTLECIAFPFGSGLVLPVIQARKDAFFFSMFRGGERLLPDTDADLSFIAQEIKDRVEKSKKIILTGPGSAGLFDKLPQEVKNAVELYFESRGFAKELIIIAKNNKIFNKDNTAFLYSGPEYIRKTDAELCLNK